MTKRPESNEDRAKLANGEIPAHLAMGEMTLQERLRDKGQISKTIVLGAPEDSRVLSELFIPDPLCHEAADALDAQEKRIRELEEGARAERDRHREEMNRWGCPYVSTVVSQEDGFYFAHQIISAHPSPQGMRVVIGSTRTEQAMTPEQENALWDKCTEEEKYFGIERWRLAIRAAYAKGVEDQRERCDDEIDNILRDADRD